MKLCNGNTLNSCLAPIWLNGSGLLASIKRSKVQFLLFAWNWTCLHPMQEGGQVRTPPLLWCLRFNPSMVGIEPSSPSPLTLTINHLMITQSKLPLIWTKIGKHVQYCKCVKSNMSIHHIEKRKWSQNRIKEKNFKL